MCATERESGIEVGESLSPLLPLSFPSSSFPTTTVRPLRAILSLSPPLILCVCCSSFLYQLRRKPLSSFCPPPRPPRSLVGSRKREEERRRRPHKQGKTAGAERRPPPPPLLNFPPKSTHLKHPQLNQQHALIPPLDPTPISPASISPPPPSPPFPLCTSGLSFPHLFRPPLFLFHRPFSGGREGGKASFPRSCFFVLPTTDDKRGGKRRCCTFGERSLRRGRGRGRIGKSPGETLGRSQRCHAHLLRLQVP